MIITLVTLFPQIFDSLLKYSILGNILRKKLVIIKTINIRDFAFDKYKSVDAKPYGGGKGMLIRVDILHKAINSSKINKKNYEKITGKRINKYQEKIILLDPRGKIFNQKKAYDFSKINHLILICGHYEGIDERISLFIDEKLSVGKYILTGGEIPAMLIIDSVSRLVKNALPKESIQIESFSKDFKYEYPQYTQPRIFKKKKVPEILLTGNHQKINQWRKNNSVKYSSK